MEQGRPRESPPGAAAGPGGQWGLTPDAFSPEEQAVWLFAPTLLMGVPQVRGSEGVVIPDDNNDAIKDVVGVLDVAEGTIDEQLQQHLQGKEAGEDDVADFQGIGKLLGLEGRAGMKQPRLGPEPLIPALPNTGPQGEEE